MNKLLNIFSLLMNRPPLVLSPHQVKGLLGFSICSDPCLSMAAFLRNITATVLINACVANTGNYLGCSNFVIHPLYYKDLFVPNLSCKCIYMYG